ncbi:hypothetical protein NCAS_0A13390 [Naumovozyma castellii]|uniref:Protein-serine/threonine kinase n=1 Tax=Naumovozyma castellii TaxID=27288 RepID=G0V8U8_NAUCA|nr:hypothetical protein NCAS_0A13390 [Naumovozyma castellii CBS 4309]CCC67897.1 hypothetical protein NCAS_0A13390 [Naumovozyma castellii CBS 4309]
MLQSTIRFARLGNKSLLTRPFFCSSITGNRHTTHAHHLKHNKAAINLSHLDFQAYYKIRSNIELLIQDYSRKPIPPLSYKFLTEYQKPLSQTEKYNLAIKTINQLISLTCRQLSLIQNLPYIVLLNPKINQINSLYLKTLESLLSITFPYDLYKNDLILSLLNHLNEEHNDTLLVLSDGLKEINNELLSNEAISKFLDVHIRDRITMKLIILNHLALLSPKTEPDMIGIIHKRVKISQFINQTFEFVNDLCQLKFNLPMSTTGNSSMITYITGEEIEFPCIPVILEYVLTEILKNSMKAHIENDVTKPIEISIFETDSDELTVRIRDYGGGIDPKIEPKIFQYSFSTTLDSTFSKIHEENNGNQRETDSVIGSCQNDSSVPQLMMPGEVENNTISGMGYGLPLCKNYLELFDGDITIQNLWGLGTDVYIKVKGPNKSLLADRK